MANLKPLLHTILLVCLCTLMAAQDCPDEIVTGNQAQLDNLMAQYPNCEDLAGRIFLGTGISDISALSGIRTIGGNLDVSGNDLLQDLSGFASLNSIGGSFTVVNCNSLSSLAGLGSLTTIGKDLNLQNNDAMTSLAGLESLQQIGEKAWLLNLDMMTSLEGPNAINSIGTELAIRQCDELQVLSGFNGLATTGTQISVDQNPMLQSISGFNGLTMVKNLWISGGENFTLCEGFSSLENIEENIGISSEGQCVVTSTASIKTAGRISFSGVISIDFTNLELVEGEFQSNAWEMEEFIGGDKLRSVGDNFILGSSLSALPQFESLETIGGTLDIEARETLEYIDGFNNLVSIGENSWGWGFDIYDHDKLTEITGFQKLKSVEGNFGLDLCDNLVSIEGIRSLEYVGGNFVFNENSSLTDCSPLCDFVNDGTLDGVYLVYGNGPSNESACSSIEKLQLNCSFTHRIVDANLLLDLDEYNSKEPNNIREKTFEEILALDDFRTAVAADGVSEVILKLQFEMEGIVSFPDNPDNIEMLWGEHTTDVEGENVLFVLFTPPDEFDSEQNTSSLNGEVDKYAVDINVELTTTESERSASEILSFNMPVEIVKPPVILVHGTLADPFIDWESRVAPYSSMKDTLESKGYKVFSVNYKPSNGSFSLLGDNSGFEQNKMILWGDVYDGNNNGIKDALRYYRDELEVAVTQVDVVGNDMGGLLARIYASDTEGGYNPEYRRSQNFEGR